MTKNSLQTCYHNNQINYSEKERLNKIGVNDYDYYNLQDLKQILLCEEWAKSNSEIRNNVGGWIIKKIIFFTPNFNDSKPDASNYSCAIITVAGYLWKHNWVIIYRPSYVSTIESDVFIKKLDISVSETENKLNGDYPILATVSSEGTEFILSYSLIDKPFVRKYNLPYDAKNNPDKYILSLDIVKRESDIGYHFAIYLGGEKVVHLPGEKLAQFDSWYRFCNPSSSSGSSSSSSSFWSSSSSSNSSSSSKNITTYHPLIPFKRKTDIIHHVAKIIGHGYGGCSCHPYNVVSNNCEHLVKRCIFNLDNSLQVETYTGALLI